MHTKYFDNIGSAPLLDILDKPEDNTPSRVADYLKGKWGNLTATDVFLALSQPEEAVLKESLGVPDVLETAGQVLDRPLKMTDSYLVALGIA